MSGTLLETELRTFDRELPRLLQASLGKFALIRGSSVDSLWDTKQQALDAGYQRFGVESFLVKEVTDHEKPLYFSRDISRCR